MKQKLIYISNVRLPTERAHGIQIMKMCEAFVRIGYDVTLVVPRRKNLITETPWDYYKMEHQFDIQYLPTWDFLGSKVLFKQVFLVQFFSFLWNAKSFVDRTYPSENYVIFSRELFALFFFRHAIIELHNLPARINWLHRYLLQRARYIVTITEHLRAAVIDIGQIQSNKVIALHDGVDLRMYDNTVLDAEAKKIRADFNFRITQKIVLYSGSFFMYPWKGVVTLLDAASKCADDIVFIFVGGTTDEIVRMEKEITQRNLNGRVIVHGRISHACVPAYMRAADICVLPNSGADIMSQFYTSPLKLFEYMASGTPIVATQVPSICEVLNDKNATLCVPDDSASLAHALQWAASHKGEVLAKAIHAMQDVVQYDWKKRAERISDFLGNMS